MLIALDTNILVAFWDADDALNRTAAAALRRAGDRARMLISGPVYSELLAGPGRTEVFLDRFLSEMGISVDWDLDDSIWRLAGTRFQQYATRRRTKPRRILADFLIGAHAARRGAALLTLDVELYRRMFPEVVLVKA